MYIYIYIFFQKNISSKSTVKSTGKIHKCTGQPKVVRGYKEVCIWFTQKTLARICDVLPIYTPLSAHPQASKLFLFATCQVCEQSLYSLFSELSRYFLVKRIFRSIMRSGARQDARMLPVK